MQANAHDQMIQDAHRWGGEPAHLAVPQLLPMLGHDDWRVRQAGVDGLLQVKPPQQVAAALWESIVEPVDPGRRNAALVALCRLGGPALPVLFQVAKAPLAAERKLAMDALGMMGLEAGVEALAEHLTDEDPNVRAAAAEGLGRVGTPQSAARLMAHLLVHVPRDPLELGSVMLGLAQTRHAPGWDVLAPMLEDPLLRTAAVGVLPFSPAPEAALALLAAARSPHGSVRAAALNAVCLAGASSPAVARLVGHPAQAARLSQAAHDLLTSREDETAGSAAAVAGWLPQAGTAATLLRHRAGRPWDAAVAQAWTCGGPQASLEVAAALPDLAASDLALALELLTLHPEPRAVEVLAAMMQTCGGELLERVAGAWLACDALSGLGELVRRLTQPSATVEEQETCERALWDALEKHGLEIRTLLMGNANVSGGALCPRVARILAACARPQDAPMLRGWLGSPDARVRAAGCLGLSRVGSPADAEALAPLLMDEDGTVRAHSARGLGQLGAEAQVPALMACRLDDDLGVRRAVLGALARLCPHRAMEILEEAFKVSPWGSVAALGAAEAHGGMVALNLGRLALHHEDPNVARAAAHAVGASHSSDAVGLLLPLLQSPTWEVRHAAAQALAALHQRSGLLGAPEKKAVAAAHALETHGLVKEVLGRVVAK